LARLEVEARYYAPEFAVEINGKELTGEMSSVISSITIQQEINKTNDFKFVVQDELRDGQFRWLGKDLFKYGNNVCVDLGYVNDKPRMMEGQIQNISANFFTGTTPTFTVEGSDKAYKFLKTNSDAEIYREKTDSQIVKEIADKAHMESVIDDTKLINPIRRKKGGQDYFKFLSLLAQANKGYEVSLSGRTLYFIESKKDKEAILSLRWGKELISFNPVLNSSRAITEVIVRSWDRKRKKKIEVSIKAGQEKKQEGNKRLASQVAREIYGDVVEVITEKPVRSVDEAKRIAMAKLEEGSDNFIKGSGETIGIPQLRPGVCIDLEGLGVWFQGKYYVEKVEHTIDSSGYRTKFDVRKNTI
jgi:phage protein D